jgi:hypothetical protein
MLVSSRPRPTYQPPQIEPVKRRPRPEPVPVAIPDDGAAPAPYGADALPVTQAPGEVAPAGPVPAGPVPAGPVPAGPVPAGPVPAGPVPDAPAPAAAGVLVRPRPLVVPDDGSDPLPEELKLDQIKARPVRNHNNRILGALETGLFAAGQDAQAHPAHDWQGLMHNVGSAAGGFGAGVARPELDEQIAHDRDEARAQDELEQAQRNQAAGSLIKSRNAATDLTLQRPGMEANKQRVALLIAQERARPQYARLTETARHNKAAEALRDRGLISLDDYRDSLIDSRDADRTERGREADQTAGLAKDRNKETSRHNQNMERLSARRTAAYERAIQSGASKQQAAEAQAGAEADMYGQFADEVDDEIHRLETSTPDDEKDDDYDRQVGALHRQQREYRAKAGKGAAKATAPLATRKPITQMTEDEVRQAARAAKPPKNEDAAVAAWKRATGNK